MTVEWEPGTEVRIGRRHWLRPLERGVIREFNPRKLRWLVEFRTAFKGGGVDGNKLWLEEHDFSAVSAPTPASIRLPRTVVSSLHPNGEAGGVGSGAARFSEEGRGAAVGCGVGLGPRQTINGD